MVILLRAILEVRGWRLEAGKRFGCLRLEEIWRFEDEENFCGGD